MLQIRCLNRLSLLILFVFTIAVLIPGKGHSQFLPWEYHDILTDIRESGVNPDFVVDGAGNFHVTYWNVHEDRLVYGFSTDNGATFNYEVIDSVLQQGFKSRLAIDSGDQPHVVYYENSSAGTKVVYAYKSGSTWQKEYILAPVSEGWGEYGFNSQALIVGGVEQSLDLTLDNLDRPFVVILGGYSNTSDPDHGSCSFSDYDLKFYQGFKDGSTWKVRQLNDPSTNIWNGPCCGSLPANGARFGEYCHILADPNGGLIAITKEDYKNDVLLYRTLSGEDTLWSYSLADSFCSMTEMYWNGLGYSGCTNFCAAGSPGWLWERRFYTIEGIGATITSNGSVHLSYGSSLAYGGNFCCKGTNSLFYTRVDSAGSVFHVNFDSIIAPSTYRNYASVTTKGADSIYVVYADIDNNAYMLLESADSGKTWINDTIYNVNSLSSYAPVNTKGDTIYTVFYDVPADILLLAKRSLSSPSDDWSVRQLTFSQERGVSVGSEIIRTSVDSAIIAYNDQVRDILYFCEGGRVGLTWNWAHEEIDTTGSNFNQIFTKANSYNDPFVVYTEGSSNILKMAHRSGTTWQYEVIDTTTEVEYIDFVIDADTLHVVYYNYLDKDLRYAKKYYSDVSWSTEVVDSSQLIIGEYPSLAIDTFGMPHVAYYDGSNRDLLYAQKDTSGTWNIEAVDTSTGLNGPGTFKSLKLSSGNSPFIAYLDPTNTSLTLAEKDSLDNWMYTVLETSGGIEMGRETDLELDQFDNPWVAYNYKGSTERIKLMHRDSIWREVAVSTTGQLASHFDFHIVEGDLFVIGKKQETKNEGLALLYADEGVFIYNDQEQVSDVTVNVFPNPAEDKATIAVTGGRTKVSAQLFDLNGKRLWSEEKAGYNSTEQVSFELNTSAIRPGIYFVVISGADFRMTEKLVIIH